MEDLIEKVIQKEKARITKNIVDKYRRKAKQEIKSNKIFLEKNTDLREQLNELEQQLLNGYETFIEQEIKERLDKFKKSVRYKKLVEKEIRSTLNIPTIKLLKRYQQFPIRIPKDFILEVTKEANIGYDKKEQIPQQEVEYVLLLILYTIIDKMLNNFTVKIGTVCKLWLNKRDFIINLPHIRNRVQEDRLIPKMELCKAFDYLFFKKLNENNEAIINYYKQKTERILILLKIKENKNANS